MNIFFNATYYLNNNPDVLQAVAQGIIPSAKFHFDNFGWKEGRDPNAFFDVSYYLTENPDVLAAGVNPLDHFIQFGAAEGRSPNADFVSSEDFDTEAYAAANPDLEAAGITTPEELYAHFVTYGFAEDRPGTQTNDGAPVIEGLPGGLAGDDFTLTAGVDELIGTAGNDTFEGLVEDLSIFDDLDGGAGDDVLNLYVEDLEGEDSVDSSGTVDVEGIETINFIYTGEAVGTGTIDGDTFQGATQIWQIGGDNNLEDLAATQTAGFRDTVVNTTINAADDVTSATVALDGVASGAALTFTGADLETVSVSGDVEASGDSDGTLELTFNSDATDEVTTVNLALTNDTELLANGTWNDVVTVDASASTGGITATLSGTDAFEAISGGSGDDNLTIGTDFTADEVTINAGAGDDTIAINGTSVFLLTLTGGAGTDTYDFSESGFNNIVNEETFEDEMIVITDFNTNEDVLDLSGLVEHELSNAELGIGSATGGILNAATLEAAVTLASGATADGEFSLFNYGDDAYALYQAVGDENGGLIKLTGVNNIDALDGSALLSSLES